MIDVKKIVADKKEAIKKIVNNYPPDTISQTEGATQEGGQADGITAWKSRFFGAYFACRLHKRR